MSLCPFHFKPGPIQQIESHPTGRVPSNILHPVRQHLGPIQQFGSRPTVGSHPPDRVLSNRPGHFQLAKPINSYKLIVTPPNGGMHFINPHAGTLTCCPRSAASLAQTTSPKSTPQPPHACASSPSRVLAAAGTPPSGMALAECCS